MINKIPTSASSLITIIMLLTFTQPGFAADAPGESVVPGESEVSEKPESSMTETPVITEVTSSEAGEESNQNSVNEQSGQVARAIFTTNIIDREPADTISSISQNVGKIFFFTELIDMTDQTVTHRWEYNGEVMAEVKFNVGAPRWRVYSVKNIQPEWTGLWQVVVTDTDGNILNTSSIDVTN